MFFNYRNSKRNPIHEVAIVSLLTAWALPVHAQSEQQQVEELRHQINELQRKVAAMEDERSKDASEGVKVSELQRKVAAMEDERSKDASEGFRVGNTNVKFGALIKLDAVDNLGQDLGPKAWPLSIDPTLSGDERASGGHLNMSARPTRLRLITSTPTDWGPVVGFVETDFDASAGGNEQTTNSYGLRLRHAYFTWNRWMFGQNWSTFSDFHFPKILDNQAPIGVTFVRQPQIRYTFDLGGGSLDLALENPDGEIRGLGGRVIASNLQLDIECPPGSAVDCGAQNPVPDVVARYRFKPNEAASLQVATLARYIKLDGATGDKSTYGWGVNIGGSYAFPTGTKLFASSFAGEGLDRYLFSPYVGDAYVDNNGDVEPIERWSASLGVSQKLAGAWSANVVYGVSGVEGLDGEQAAINARCSFAGTQQGLGCVARRFSDIHANVIYQVSDSLLFGVEYIYTKVEYQDKAEGEAHTVMFSAEYGF